jgi:hypothetical protein
MKATFSKFNYVIIVKLKKKQDLLKTKEVKKLLKKKFKKNLYTPGVSLSVLIA